MRGCEWEKGIEKQKQRTKGVDEEHHDFGYR